MDIYMDVDGCIFHSIQCVTDIYRLRYHNHPDYIDPIPEQCERWNMADIMPLMNEDEMEGIFSSTEFFDMVTVNKDFINLIKDLQIEGHRVIICSVGSIENVTRKLKFLNKILPNTPHLPIVSEWNNSRNRKVDKSYINMECGIFVDDSASNLNMSNATHRILFNEYGKWDCEWNKDFQGIKCGSVDKLRKEIYTIIGR